jgi:hypothetical protein
MEGVSSTIRSSLTERGVWSCAVGCSKVWDERAEGLLISYEPELACSEDLVEYGCNEQCGETGHEDEEYWIDHPARILCRTRQLHSRPRAEGKCYFNQIIRVTGT